MFSALLCTSRNWRLHEESGPSPSRSRMSPPRVVSAEITSFDDGIDGQLWQLNFQPNPCCFVDYTEPLHSACLTLRRRVKLPQHKFSDFQKNESLEMNGSHSPSWAASSLLFPCESVANAGHASGRVQTWPVKLPAIHGTISDKHTERRELLQPLAITSAATIIKII